MQIILIIIFFIWIVDNFHLGSFPLNRVNPRYITCPIVSGVRRFLLRWLQSRFNSPGLRILCQIYRTVYAYKRKSGRNRRKTALCRRAITGSKSFNSEHREECYLKWQKHRIYDNIFLKTSLFSLGDLVISMISKSVPFQAHQGFTVKMWEFPLTNTY